MACPQCQAAIGDQCTNYRGAGCAPHSARKVQAQAPLTIGQQADGTFALPAPPATQSPTPTPPPPDRTAELAAAIRALLAHHTSGAIIDAAWEESGKLFRQQLARDDAKREAQR